MKKILIVSKFMHHVGGVETYIDWQARHLPKRGYECAFFGMAGNGAEPMESVQDDVFVSPHRSYSGNKRVVMMSAADSVYSPIVGRKLRQAIEEFRPDLVHFHGTCYQLTSSVALVAKRYKLPSVVTAHEYKFVCANQRLWNDHSNSPCLLCVGKTTLGKSRTILKESCVKGSRGASMLAATEQIVSTANWRRLNPLIHAPSRYMLELLQRDAVSDNIVYNDLPWSKASGGAIADTEKLEFTVAYFGRLVSEKGVDRLLDVWPDVVAKCPRAILRIYGSGSEQPALEKKVRSIGDRSVHFMGRYRISDLSEIMSGVDVTVHPSIWAENSPYTVRESLQFGVPAIVSDQGGLPEMVSHLTGRVFDSSDFRTLVNALVDEYSEPRARSATLLDAVAERTVTDEQHLDALDSMYLKASELVLKAGRARHGQ